MDSQLTTAQGYRWKDLLLGPPRPRHEVLVLVDGLDRAVLHALQHARQLNPLSTTALHDQTGRDLFAALNRLAGVNVAIVHPPPTTPTADEFPASRYARRQLVLRS